MKALPFPLDGVLNIFMAHITPRIIAADLPIKAQTRLVRWMLQMVADPSKEAKSELTAGIDGRIVTFHGRAGEAQLKAIILDKDVALYRWKRGLDLELRTALAQDRLSQKCGVLTSDASVITALDNANLREDENEDGEPVSVFDVSLGVLTDAEQNRVRSR